MPRSSYARGDDAFSKAHSLSPNDAEILYWWSRFMMRKARGPEGFHILVGATNKMISAIEREPKIEHFNAIIECFLLLDERAHSAKSVVQGSNMARLQEWMKQLRSGIEKIHQRHKQAHGECRIIDWETLDVRALPFPLLSRS